MDFGKGLPVDSTQKKIEKITTETFQIRYILFDYFTGYYKTHCNHAKAIVFPESMKHKVLGELFVGHHIMPGDDVRINYARLMFMKNVPYPYVITCCDVVEFL